MANTVTLAPVTRLVSLYVLLVVATLVALGLLTAFAPSQAGSEAWGHAVIVAGFAVLLPLRLRAARRGDGGALRAVTVISAVLLVVNAVEAAVPGLFPAWMRVEMVGIVCLMALLVVTSARARR